MCPAGYVQTPDDELPSPLLAMKSRNLQFVWAKCTFGAKAALACTCRELRQKSQAWQWGRVPGQQEDAFQWWLSHRRLAHWNEFVVRTSVSMPSQGDFEAAQEVQAVWEPGQGKVMSGSLPGVAHLLLQLLELGFGEVSWADAGLCTDAALSSLLPEPHHLTVMTGCACRGDDGQLIEVAPAPGRHWL